MSIFVLLLLWCYLRVLIKTHAAQCKWIEERSSLLNANKEHLDTNDRVKIDVKVTAMCVDTVRTELIEPPVIPYQMQKRSHRAVNINASSDPQYLLPRLHRGAVGGIGPGKLRVNLSIPGPEDHQYKI